MAIFGGSPTLPLLNKIQENTEKTKEALSETNTKMDMFVTRLESLETTFSNMLLQPMQAIIRIFSPEFFGKLFAPITQNDSFIGPPQDPEKVQKEQQDFYNQILDSFQDISKGIQESIDTRAANEADRKRLEQERKDREERRKQEEKEEAERQAKKQKGFMGTLLNPQIGEEATNTSSKWLTGMFLYLSNPALINSVLKAMVLGKVIPIVARAMFTPITAIITSIGYGLYDAFSKADIVGEMTGNGDFVGGLTQFIFGEANKGIMDNVMHLGKWAGMGALAGAAFGPVGLIGGAIIGAGIGAALDFIGGSAFADYLQRGVDRISTLNTLFFEGDETTVNEKRKAITDQIQQTNDLLKGLTEKSLAKSNEITELERQIAEARASNNDTLAQAFSEQLEKVRNDKIAIEEDIQREISKLDSSKENLKLLESTNYGDRIILALNSFADYLVADILDDVVYGDTTVGDVGVKIKDAWETFDQSVIDLQQKANDNVRSVWTRFDQSIIDMQNRANEWTSAQASSITNYFTNMWSSFDQSVIAFNASAVAWKDEKIANFNSMISDNLGFLFNSDFYLSHITNLQALISEKITGVTNGISEIFSFDNISTAIISLQDSIISSFTNFIDAIKNKVTGGLDSLKNKALNLVTFGYYGEETPTEPGSTTGASDAIVGGEGVTGVAGNAGVDYLTNNSSSSSVVNGGNSSNNINNTSNTQRLNVEVPRSTIEKISLMSENKEKLSTVNKDNYYDIEKSKVVTLASLAKESKEERDRAQASQMTQAIQSVQNNNMISNNNTNVTNNSYSGMIEVRDRTYVSHTRGAF